MVFLRKLPGQQFRFHPILRKDAAETSQKDFNEFMEISLGSSFELETQLLIAEAVNFGEKEKRDDLLKDINEEQKMIMSFMSKLKL